MTDRPLRRPREQRELQPTDFDERLTALKRRTAAASRPRERAVPPPPPSQTPAAPIPRSSRTMAVIRRVNNSNEADYDDFSRRLKISSPPPQSKPLAKLYNPQADIFPLRRTAEPEVLSDATSSSHPRSPSGGDRESQARQLFDHRKDDPVRFSVLARPPRPIPTPKSSGDYVSASSTSSYANSVSSSAFTLSSTTDGSSASSALFDHHSGSRGDEGGNNVFAVQLKKLYRAITNLETKVKTEDSEDRDRDDSTAGAGERGEARITLKGKQPEDTFLAEEDVEREKWKVQITNHKQLADYIHNLLQISLAPTVPASLRNIPTRYNIIVRLWTYAFHKLLESLRRASFSSHLAFEHLQDFIYYAYGFYTGLLEEPTLSGFKSGWLEALGDLARYRMAVAAMVNGGIDSSASSGRKLTQKDVNEVVTDKKIDKPDRPTASISDKPAARIDDSPSPSVGLIAARSIEIEPEPELWRRIAKEWYGSGLSEQPGTGKLHHHLGLLSREVEGEELRGIYHFVKSMTTLHPFPTSRESILSMWPASAQARRAQSDTAAARDLFVLLHGMLFTHIQLDDFAPTLARFVERLEMEEQEERDWLMMAIVNIASVFEYGKPGSVLGRLGGKESITAPIMMAKPTGVNDEKMEVDEPKKASSPVPPPRASTDRILPTTLEAAAESASEYSPSFKYALQLTFAVLSNVLKHPIRKPLSAFGAAALNPYLVAVLTFLATVSKNQQTLAALERSIPWEELATFFAKIPRGVMTRQGLLTAPEKKGLGPRWIMLTSGCAPPLPEDWCMRGMEWVGRSVFERGYWKVGEERRMEIEVLDEREMGEEATDGRIEDDDDGDDDAHVGSRSGGAVRRVDIMRKRWVRIVRSAIGISSVIDGFTWVEGTREWKVEGELAEKVASWREQDRQEREVEERRRLGTRWADDPMDVDGEDVNDFLSEEDDDESDTEEVKALKARRRYLQSLLQPTESPPSTSPSPTRRPRATKQVENHPLSVIPGYTVLVIDTNILLSSLSMISSIIESLQWTVVVPLPVIMELDGLSANPSPQLSEAAQAAMTSIASYIRSHALSLKVQTSKGNYLTSLSIRTEQVDFSTDGNWERSMDDLILKAAIWQDEHWLDRSAMLKRDSTVISKDMSRAVKVVLLSLDRNLRLKARSRHLPAASEKDLASILANAI